MQTNRISVRSHLSLSDLKWVCMEPGQCLGLSFKVQSADASYVSSVKSPSSHVMKNPLSLLHLCRPKSPDNSSLFPGEWWENLISEYGPTRRLWQPTVIWRAFALTLYLWPQDATEWMCKTCFLSQSIHVSRKTCSMYGSKSCPISLHYRLSIISAKIEWNTIN